MYPVNLHMHTVANARAYSMLSDYIAQAKQKGIRLFAVTDRGPDVEDASHHWYFISIRIWPRVVGGVGTLRGIETNIKNVDGETDYNSRIFDSLDLIVAGFHGPVFAPHDKATGTQAMIATIASDNVHIINYPRNPKYKIGVRTAVEAAAKHQVALEINNSPFLHSHKDNEDSCHVVAAAVRDAGGWVTLGLDSHTTFTIGEFRECLRILDVVDFPPERILNVSPRRLLNFLESRGMTPIAEFADL